MEFPPSPTQFTSGTESALGIPLLAVTHPEVDELVQTPEYQIHELRARIDTIEHLRITETDAVDELFARVYDLEHPWRRRWLRFRTWLSQTF